MLLKLIFICTFGVLLVNSVCRQVHQRKYTGTDVTLQVYHYKVPCIGESVQMCYKVEQKIGDPEYFYDTIEGFRYDWGYNYTIIVEKKNHQAPMSGASSFTYTLKRIVAKEKVSPDETFELPLRIDDLTLIEKKKEGCLYFGSIPVETGWHSCSNVSKAARAVFRHGTGSGSLVLVQLK
jgi:hypothetical protein